MYTFMQIILFLFIAEINSDLIEKCCVLGSEWANVTRGACTAYPAELLDSSVPASDKGSCASLANICCTQSFRHRQCMSGRDIAVTTDTCSNIRVVRGNTVVYINQKVSKSFGD